LKIAEKLRHNKEEEEDKRKKNKAVKNKGCFIVQRDRHRHTNSKKINAIYEEVSHIKISRIATCRLI